MTTNDCLNKEWVKKIFSENNSAKFYVECYDNFLLHFSCTPDTNLFPKYKEGDVIDEDKSVKWNREEVQRRIDARENEVKRLKREKSEITKLYEDGLKQAIAKDHEIKVKEVELLWAYFYREHHSCGVQTVYCYLDEFLCETYSKIKECLKSI